MCSKRTPKNGNIFFSRTKKVTKTSISSKLRSKRTPKNGNIFFSRTNKVPKTSTSEKNPQKWEYSSLIPTNKVPKTSTSKKNPQKWEYLFFKNKKSN